jgi:hypothetical protein
MMTEDLIVKMALGADDMRIIRIMAQEWDYPGASNIRDPIDRANNLSEDAMTGQIGNYAGIKYWDGSVFDYMVTRFYARQQKFKGDQGYDRPACTIDFKASKIRNLDKALLEYHLRVPPKERRPGWTYVLILTEWEMQRDNASVYLIGWATDEMLPQDPTPKDSFWRGDYILQASNLWPLPPLKYHWFPQGA